MNKSKSCLLIGMLHFFVWVGITKADQSNWTVTTLAGAPGTVINSIDATGEEAQFYSPRGVTIDAEGNLFIADSSNNTIRKVTPEGVVTTIAGTAGQQGLKDGKGQEARFVDPYGITSDRAGNLYIADTSNNAIRKITPDGTVTTIAGRGASGSSSTASFLEPRGIAADNNGNLYVADYGNHIVTKITQNGTASTLAGSKGNPGSEDGDGSSARFCGLLGVAVDQSGNVFVADTGNRKIRKITPDGQVSTFAGSGQNGSTDGPGTTARFSEPRSLALDANDNLYVSDYSAHNIRKVSPSGEVTTIAGSSLNPGSLDAKGTTAQFYGPSGLSVDNTGNVYVVDTLNNTLRKISSDSVVTTLAGMAGRTSSKDGTGSDARFEDPYAVTADSYGNVYVADASDHSIRKVTPEGIVTTIAGLPGTFGSTDGIGTEARFFSPLGIAVDIHGTVYVADTGNQTIRKIAPDGTVTVFAGTPGQAGSQNGVGTSARFSSPYGIAVDWEGWVYVVEPSGTVRKISPEAVVTTLAGKQGSVGMIDGVGTAASFSVPFDVTVDADGNVYVCDHGNHAIRKITPDGVVSTLAGNGSAGATDGTGSDATFRWPSGIAVDATGNVWVADNDNHAIRMVTPAGVVTTIAGSPGIVGSADGTGDMARFFNSKDVAVDTDGNFYVADRGNHTIRKGSYREREEAALRILKTGETATITSHESVFGASGNETVLITDQAHATLDGNVERVELQGRLDRYTFSVAGTRVDIFAGSLNPVSFIGLNQRVTLAFANGSAPLELKGLDNATLGGSKLNTNPSAINATLNTQDTSTITSNN